MLHCFAPLEGITNALYRNCHFDHFGPLDGYYAPFVTPNRQDGVGRKELRDLLPENNRAVPLVPQLLCNDGTAFLAGAEALAAIGCHEVNLNLGCPSGTVVAKGRGSGLLAKPDDLRRFFDEVFPHCPIPVSVKTRLGLTTPDEFPAILSLFNDYPICELILHPRLRTDYYKNHPNMEMVSYALQHSRAPLSYSGDLFTVKDIKLSEKTYPGIKSIFLGRGLLANPALSRMARGGAPLRLEELKQFHEDLYRQYQEILSGPRPVLHKMKELWFYMICLFADHQKHAKALGKAQTLPDLESAIAAIFRDLPFDPNLGFLPK